MSIGDILYTILIGPLQLFFEVIFMWANNITRNPGVSIIVLSLAMNFLVLPLYRRADAMQEEERDMEMKLQKGVAHIKKAFKGDERMMILQTYYRQNHYKPTYVLKGATSLFLEIPFFIAAYQFLSHLQLLNGVNFGVIRDLGAQDALLSIGGRSVNLLPIIMTAVNLISCVIFTKGYPKKTKVQLYSMAIFFLFFLYSSPAGLVFYWTLNNVFSLVKTIFYKLKNSKKILTWLFACAGACLTVYALGFYKAENMKPVIYMTGIGLLCIFPLVFSALKKVVNIQITPWKMTTNNKVFISGAMYLTVLTGALIPASVIAASPQEFVDISYYVNPVWYVISALCYAFGLFVVWCGVFYWLAGTNKQKYFDIGIWLIAGAATVEYLFYGKNHGNLSSALQYNKKFECTRPEQLQNLGVILVVLLVLLLAYLFMKYKVANILLLASIALVIMAGNHFVQINRSVSELSDQVASAQEEVPSFTLHKNGQNVVVLMMDRALGELVPYLINEKPELKEQFSGFTYYSNVISFGGHTNFGAPALYGGYEYTPVEMNRRSSESLMEKHNEALKVMPVLFEENGFDVTVCDPTYANYQWIPDLSIYDDYPEIQTYISEGKFADKESKLLTIKNRKRNFFCYSLMKIAPVFLQAEIYDKGNYNHWTDDEYTDTQIVESNHVANGMDASFMNSYTTLQNLSTMTEITEEEGDSFLMMSNDATHEITLLQEPDYVPAEHIDNTEYEAEHADRYTVNGVTLTMETEYQFRHYQANMAAFLQIGSWLDYLKENGVYDNTRIIIVSDHGNEVNQLENLILEDENGVSQDLEYYYPLLMVKDFNAKEFSASDEFMTNGDVPTLATKGVIENPVNPFTGKEITNDEKMAHDQYILASDEWGIQTNIGNVYLPGLWLYDQKDMRDKNNWKIMSRNATSPLE